MIVNKKINGIIGGGFVIFLLLLSCQRNVDSRKTATLNFVDALWKITVPENWKHENKSLGVQWFNYKQDRVFQLSFFKQNNLWDSLVWPNKMRNYFFKKSSNMKIQTEGFVKLGFFSGIDVVANDDEDTCFFWFLSYDKYNIFATYFVSGIVSKKLRDKLKLKAEDVINSMRLEAPFFVIYSHLFLPCDVEDSRICEGFHFPEATCNKYFRAN